MGGQTLPAVLRAPRPVPRWPEPLPSSPLPFLVCLETPEVVPRMAAREEPWVPLVLLSATGGG